MPSITSRAPPANRPAHQDCVMFSVAFAETEFFSPDLPDPPDSPDLSDPPDLPPDQGPMQFGRTGYLLQLSCLVHSRQPQQSGARMSYDLMTSVAFNIDIPLPLPEWSLYV